MLIKLIHSTKSLIKQILLLSTDEEIEAFRGKSLLKFSWLQGWSQVSGSLNLELTFLTQSPILIIRGVAGKLPSLDNAISLEVNTGARQPRKLQILGKCFCPLESRVAIPLPKEIFQSENQCRTVHVTSVRNTIQIVSMEQILTKMASVWGGQMESNSQVV